MTTEDDEYTRGLVDGLRRASDRLFAVSQELMRNADAVERSHAELLEAPPKESVPNVGTGTLKVLHTDGCCSMRMRVGGWAWVDLADERASYGAESDTTNNRMEIKAAYHAVLENQGDLRIVSDSRYVVDSLMAGWLDRWSNNGWRTNAKDPVRNQDLWAAFLSLLKWRRAAGDTIVFEWVKGHNGDPGNEAADALAGRAAKDYAEGLETAA